MSKGQLSFYFVALQKLSSRAGTCWSLYPVASLASLDQILDENKTYKGKYLGEK